MSECPFCASRHVDLEQHLDAAHPQHRGAARVTIAPLVSPKRALRHLRALYGGVCLACQRREPVIRLTVDHVIPLSWGGTNSLDNIQPLCTECNRTKGARLIDYRGAASHVEGAL